MQREKSRYIVLAALVYFFLANTISFVEDLLEDEHDGSWHVLFEGMVTLLTFIAVWVIWREIRSGWRKVTRLKHNLDSAQSENQAHLKQLQIFKQEFQVVLAKEFSQWGLTESEKEIAVLLLKGLSLEEVATVRDTKEKTIRQQASAIYRKSNLKGRHELSAYFLEDLL